MNNWAIIGLGFISQRHMDAIRNVGDRLIAVCDIDNEKREKVSKDIPFFNDYKKMLKEMGDIEWVAICTPNYLHYPMIVDCLMAGKNILCEKPLVINYGDFQRLVELKKSVPERELFTVLQLRLHPEVELFKRKFIEGKYGGDMKILINRGQFYFDGWKGNEKRSGGLLFNIGIHYFDLLFQLFGSPIHWGLSELTDRKSNGRIMFNNVNIDWIISLEASMDNQFRKIEINNEMLDLTRNFEDLHTKIYENLKQDKGFGLEEIGRTIKFIEQMNNAR